MNLLWKLQLREPSRKPENTNFSPVKLFLDCLRYWVTDYRVDGFRFDLASILGRNEDGSPMSQPPLLQSLAFDPILGNVKLIAEHGMRADSIRLAPFRPGDAGPNGTDATGMTCGVF
mgnify:CR=1 FL=1